MKTTDFIKESAIAVAAEAMEKESEVQLARQDCHAIAKGAIELYHILKDLPEMTDLDNECVANLNMCAKYIEEALEYFDVFTQPAEGSFTLESAEAMFNQLVNEGVDYDQIRKDAEAHLKTSLDKQSDGRIEALKKSKKENDKNFLQKVGDKQIGMVKGAVKGAWKGLTQGKDAVEEEEMDEGWQNWDIWRKLNGDSDDLDDSSTRFNKYYADKIKKIAGGGGIGVQPTNGWVEDAIRLAYQHIEQQNPNLDARQIQSQANKQVQADVQKAMAGLAESQPEDANFVKWMRQNYPDAPKSAETYANAKKHYAQHLRQKYKDHPAYKEGVAEAKGLAKKVRVAKGEHAGKIGWIREIKHGAFKGAPKSFFVDLEDGTQLNNVPGSALRLVKEDAGATGSSSIAAVVGGLGETNGKTKLIKRQGKMSNVLQPPKAIKVKGGY